jgi:Domain of unknown function (DU1801)
MAPRQIFQDAAVEAAFAAYPAALRANLLGLRALIFATAHQAKGVGALVESLKWGQPSYRPSKPRVGTTVRIDALKSAEPGYAMFFHCQTTLVGTFRELYGDKLAFQGDRAIVFAPRHKVPRAALSHCIALALTYHLDAKQR